MRHTDEIPPAPQVRIERPSLLHGAALLIGTVSLIYAAVFLYRWATEPIVMLTPASSSPGSTTSSLALTPSEPSASFPPEMIQMAVAITTSLAPSPTPIPPTPTYSMLPTPVGISVCLTITPKGEICTQPKPPAPTSTPMADCPVSPGAPCVWRGGPVTWLPTPMPAFVSSDGG